jgi:phage baseplate assembly protein W
MANNDLYFTEDGDLARATNGDIAVTTSEQQFIVQQCQMRLATERGDFVTYPNLGASLQQLIGLPNTQATARFGQSLIEAAICYDNLVARGRATVEATPTGPDTIVFNITIPVGNRQSVQLTLTQILRL